LPLLSSKVTAETEKKTTFSKEGDTLQRLLCPHLTQAIPILPLPDILMSVTDYSFTYKQWRRENTMSWNDCLGDITAVSFSSIPFYPQ